MCKFTMYNGRQTPSDGKSSHGLWPGELKRCNKGTSIKVLVLRSNLTCIRGFSVKFFFQPIYTDYANYAYFDKRSYLNL